MTMTHKLINTPAELDEAIAEVTRAQDNLVLRDSEGCTWEFGPDDAEWAPEEGWGAGVRQSDYPFLVLWWPGSVIVTNPRNDKTVVALRPPTQAEAEQQLADIRAGFTS
jgi:hypothetical protein